jgi:hypothetical protein
MQHVDHLHLVFLRAIHAVIAVAVARCRPIAPAIDSSPIKSPVPRKERVASLPARETLARPSADRSWSRLRFPEKRTPRVPSTGQYFALGRHSPEKPQHRSSVVLARSPEWPLFSVVKADKLVMMVDGQVSRVVSFSRASRPVDSALTIHLRPSTGESISSRLRRDADADRDCHSRTGVEMKRAARPGAACPAAGDL